MMPRYVAFLRGINVGGHIIKKEKLREAFTSLGFRNVTTYKQSGNVVFESSNTDTQELKKRIEDKLRLVLGFDTPVLLRTMEQLKTIIEEEPFKNQNQEGTSFLVTMLPSVQATLPLQFPLTIPKSTARVISAKGSEVFSVTHGSGEGALPNPFIESKLKLKATTRNINIIREIVEKYGK
jgi:uncharacterized protein (DUF1697 family)